MVSIHICFLKLGDRVGWCGIGIVAKLRMSIYNNNVKSMEKKYFDAWMRICGKEERKYEIYRTVTAAY